ncbi:MAG: hypothetical protein ACLP7Q_20385 [Isosphaeraceae bacterium]
MDTDPSLTSEQAASDEHATRKWVAALLACMVLSLGMMVTRGSRLAARQEETEHHPSPEPVFHRFGKDYVGVSNVSHVIDEPGPNQPPGSLQVHFGGGFNWTPIAGDEAEAFRKFLTKITVDLTPKTTPKEADSKDKKPGTGPTKKKTARPKLEFIEIGPSK